MPRPRRLNIADIPQHITQRGNNRQVCFFCDEDRFTYLDILRRTAQRRKCDIHAYVLMTNHVHLLLTPMVPDGASRFMQDVGREYVRYVNKAYQRCGTLWQGRFKSSLVHSSDYCLTCYRYIELNPVRAGMVPSPAEYFWSSHRCNAMGWENDLITPQEEWLSLGQSKDARCAAYRTLFEQAANDERLAEIRYCIRKGLPLGDPSFKVQIESHLRVRLGNGKVGRPRKPD